MLYTGTLKIVIRESYRTLTFKVTMRNSLVVSIAIANDICNNTNCNSLQNNPNLQEVAKQLSEYFNGQRTHFDLAFDQEQGTPFQRKVWAALRNIPYGETRTYGEIAQAVGCPKGARAVGMACNKNPLLIVTPCHRVIGANGNLTGFACGTDIKQLLLDLEQK